MCEKKFLRSVSNSDAWEGFLAVRSFSPVKRFSRGVTITLLMNSPAKARGCKALAGNGLGDVIQIPFVFESSDSSNSSSVLGVRERR